MLVWNFEVVKWVIRKLNEVNYVLGLKFGEINFFVRLFIKEKSV